MNKNFSKIATQIDNEYRKQKRWDEKKNKERFIILGEHTRKPLIIKEKEERR